MRAWPVIGLFWSLQVLLFLYVIPNPTTITACYTSIFSFGDSLADTGNLYYLSRQASPNCCSSPYGETYFQLPTGRCSDGRLIVDFIADSLGLPFLKPYLGIKNGKGKNLKLQEGMNFAVAGATALDGGFFEEKGFDIEEAANYSLRVQLGWFKELLPSLCNSSSSCKRILRSSLFIVGEFGGNDYGYPISLSKGLGELKTYVPQVVSAISSAIEELINIGVVTLMVPGCLPLGCNPSYLTRFGTIYEKEYDQTGCLKWLNLFYEYHNEQLQNELHRIRVLYPQANIIYADFYNAALEFYNSPQEFGFTGTGLRVCCGGGGRYNFNASVVCGSSGVIACDDPSRFVSWDGLHLTEAAYGWIAKGLLDGLYTIPKISALCVLEDVTSGDFNANK